MRVTQGVYKKKVSQLWHIIAHYVYPFTFFIPIKIRPLAVECYLSCIIAMKNSQVRSDLRITVGFQMDNKHLDKYSKI